MLDCFAKTAPPFLKARFSVMEMFSPRSTLRRSRKTPPPSPPVQHRATSASVNSRVQDDVANTPPPKKPVPDQQRATSARVNSITEDEPYKPPPLVSEEWSRILMTSASLFSRAARDLSISQLDHSRTGVDAAAQVVSITVQDRNVASTQLAPRVKVHSPADKLRRAARDLRPQQLYHARKNGNSASVRASSIVENRDVASLQRALKLQAEAPPGNPSRAARNRRSRQLYHRRRSVQATSIPPVGMTVEDHHVATMQHAARDVEPPSAKARRAMRNFRSSQLDCTR
eukprot:2251283-Rhodomonas_salina.1